jgi:prepilin-type N-terminal cleavage/methylation domain-containing protein
VRPVTLCSARTVGRRLRGCERGTTLIELLVSMSILGLVIGALVTVFTSGANAEAQLNLRFQSQSEARIAIDAMRSDIHSACAATVSGGTKVSLTNIDTTKVSYPCTIVGPSWCTVGSGTSYTLYRRAGSTSCGSSDQRRANYITGGSIFSIATATGQLPQVVVSMTVNRQPATPRFKYVIDDSIALRNARRT